MDEEWRVGGFAHAPRFAGYDACLCFEAGERDAGGDEAVIARRKAASTLQVRAHAAAPLTRAPPRSGGAAPCWRSPRSPAGSRRSTIPAASIG